MEHSSIMVVAGDDENAVFTDFIDQPEFLVDPA
jgi:hypothetical protein